MTKFVAYDPALGEILVWGDVEDPQFQAIDGRLVLEVDAGGDTHHVVGGAVVAYTDAQRSLKAARPDFLARWDNAVMGWVDLRGLDQAKADQWASMREARAAAMLAGFLWDGSRFDADDVSQQRIQGAVQLAVLAASAGQAFSVDWTLFDNSTRTLSGSDMVSVGVALGAFVQQAFATGVGLRQQIDAATTVEQVKAVQWPM